MKNHELRQKLRDSDFEGGVKVKVLSSCGVFEIEDVVTVTDDATGETEILI